MLYSNLHGEQAEEVAVKLAELNERVSRNFLPLSATRYADATPFAFNLQAKELEIYETQPFLRSALFARNGYSVVGKEIVKRFERRRPVDEDEEM